MTFLHPRIAYLAELLGLHSQKHPNENNLRELVLHRLEQKCERLLQNAPGLGPTGSETTISLACGISKWRRLIQAIAKPGCFGELSPGRWSVAELLPAAMDIGSTEQPLTDGQRLYARHFAIRLTKALALEYPAGYDLAARLYGAESWLALVGSIPFLPPDEPLYTYSTSPAWPNSAGILSPSPGCARLTAELAALTHLAAPEAQAYAARNALARRPNFLLAACIAIDALLRQGADDEVIDCANRTLRALEENVLPVSPRLYVSNPVNVHYYRLRCARIIALQRIGRFDDAARERHELVAEFESAGHSGTAQTARWLSDYEADHQPPATTKHSLPMQSGTRKA